MTEAEIKAAFFAAAESAGGITQDAEGRRILRALTFEETEAMGARAADYALGRKCQIDSQTYSALWGRHRAACEQAVAAMVEARGKAAN
jgi:hypothetical protein